MTKQSKAFRFIGFNVWREKPGQISPGYCWCCYYDSYLHTADTLRGLIWSVITEYKHDRHLA